MSVKNAVSIIACASSLSLAVAGCSSGTKTGTTTSPTIAGASKSVTTSGSPGTSASPSGTAGSTDALNGYYPISEGSTWVYRTDYGPRSLGIVTYTEKVARVAPAGADTNVSLQRTFHYANGKTRDFTVTTTYTFHKDGSISIPYQNPIEIPNTRITVKSGKIVWPSAAELESGKPKTGSVALSATVSGRTFDETVAFTIQGKSIESVKVPAGTFQARRMDQTMNITINGLAGATTISTTSWLAKGTGMVRTIVKGGTALPDGTTTADVETVLVSFTKG